MKSLLTILVISFSSFSDIEIDPPSNWQRQFRIPQGVLQQYIAPPSNKKFNANLIITDSKVTGKIKKSLGKNISEKQVRMFPLYKIIEMKEKKISDFQGTLLIVSYAYGALDLAAYQFFFIKGDKMYSVVYTCLLSDLKKMQSKFEKSLNTISFSDHKKETKKVGKNKDK